MAELEKKFSDFQKNECDEIVVEQPVDERLCPSCFPNPSFSLPDYWYNIEEAYLNEKVCEYHIRVYSADAKIKSNVKEEIMTYGIQKMLAQFDKLLNNGTIEQLMNVAFIVDTHIDTRQSELGTAYLIGVPSISFDQIPSIEDEGDEDNSTSTPPTEALVEYNGLYKKTIQLGGALRIYNILYSSAAQLGEQKGITLVYAQDPSRRLDIQQTRKQLKRFRKLLNLTLRYNDYQGIDYPSFIRKRYKKIKFIFEEDKAFVIKSIFVLDESCDEEYIKLKIPPTAIDLVKEGFGQICYYMSNLDVVINDITSKETRPWLEFLLDHSYPKIVANYGDYEQITEEDYVDLGCLFEKSLGLGSGQVTNYLARETLSFFKTLENDAYKSACRSINDLTDTEEQKQARAKTSEDLREERTISKYKESFINDYYKKNIDAIRTYSSGASPDNKLRGINKENFWQLTQNAIGFIIPSVYLGPSYKYKNEDGEKKEGPPVSNNITTKNQLESAASDYATTRFALMDRAWGTRFKNNADWEEMKESYNEAFNPENGFWHYLFGTEPEDTEGVGKEDERKVLNTIGLCGMSKLTGKLLKCLLGGVTIEDFYGIMAEKALEFMNVNTLGLFLNSLPSSFRTNLNNALEEQFGDIDLVQLINIKSEDGASVKDIVGFSKPSAIMKAFERSPDPLRDPKITRDDKEFLRNNIGEQNSGFYQSIKLLYSIHYNYEDSEYIQTGFPAEMVSPSTAGTTNETKEYKTAKKYLKKVVKHARRSYLKGSDTFAQANTKLKKRIDLFGEYNRPQEIEEPSIPAGTDALERSLNKSERINKSLNETNLGVKTDVIFDVVFDFTIDYILDLMNVDQLMQILNRFPGADLAFGFISDFLKSCPHPPLFTPPASDFMKSFSVDVCDPEINMKLPSINFPSLSLRYNLEKQFGDNFRNAIVSLISKIAIDLLKKVMNGLEDSICKILEAGGGFVAEGIEGGDLIRGAVDNFQKALDEAFCGGSVNPETGNSRASELANGLFNPTLINSGSNYEGAGNRVSNIISSVVSQDEILRAIVDGDDKTNKLISNAIRTLSPEMNVLLGTPSQVATFFRNLKSYLPPEDQQRIRDLLDAGIPNLPLTSQICLTNDQLKAWNDMRNAMLQEMGLTPEQAADKVAKLNEEVQEALESTIGDALTLDNPEGPFIGALTDEALKDVCNPDNLFNDVSDSDLSKEESKSLNEQDFDLLKRIMIFSFTGRNGIFGNALRAKDNSREGWFRSIKKFFNSNYANTQLERDAAEEAKGTLGAAVMNRLTEDKSVIGDYPETVGILLRDQLLENQNYSMPGSFSTVFEEGDAEAYYKSRQKFLNLDDKQDFSYTLQVIQTFGDPEGGADINYRIPIEISNTQEEEDYLESIGVQIDKSSSPLRKRIFQKIIEKNMPLNKNHGPLYDVVFEMMMSKMIEASVTNEANAASGSVSTGYLFGYVSEDIKKEHFEYKNEDGTPYTKGSNVLGKYGNDRIKVLNPEVYGGRYSNPPYAIEPRKFVGWLEYATKSFTSQEGCDPKRPPMLDINDIKNRVQFLENNLSNYPEMTKDKDCVNEKPFKLLINNKTRAKMDGTVRSTLRCYIAESFIQGIGTFSNIHPRPENYDPSFYSYVAKKIKSEMSELGGSLFGGRLSIVQTTYWYTFLEQCVQSYQTMYDLGEISPPPHVLEALEEISTGQSLYTGVSRSTKKTMKNIVENLKNRPLLKNRESTIMQPAVMSIYAMDFRVSDDKDGYFGSGPIDPRIDKGLIRRSSVKKLRFFTKIFAIRMYEAEAMIILGELISNEMARLTETAFDGLNDKPLVWDLNKSFVGLKTFFPNSNSNVGFNSYYLNKQEGTANAGDIPDTKLATSNPIVSATDEPQLVVEKYARIKAKGGVQIALNDGIVPLNSLKGEIDRLKSINPEGYLSDYFGNLRFVYEGSFKQLLDKGFTDSESLNRLAELNIGTEVDASLLQNSLSSYVSSQQFEDFQLIYDDFFVLEGENPEPQGTTGDLGINYGIRICLVLPEGYLSESEKQSVSRQSGPRVFPDGTVMVPLVASEVSGLDEELIFYNPVDMYDLECVINKMVETEEYKILFNKIFPLQMATSMSAIFNSENFMASIGRGEGERTEEALETIEAGLDEDEWEGITHEFLKNYLRRQFRSNYLSNDIDGFSIELLGARERLRLFGNFNPFDIFSLPSVKIPWFRKRRLKLRVYDAYGNECADPTKDFE